jgi:hypothetical protein
MFNGLKFKSTVAAACLATIVGTTTAAQAQVSVNYSFKVPIAKVVPNPCTGGFTLLDGTASLAVTTVHQSTAPFQVKVALASSGRGQDALSSGIQLLGNPDYVYTSTASLTGTFPEGVPTYFEHTLTAVDFLVRDTPELTGDSYVMRTVVRLKLSNGLPAVPTLVSIAVVCD